MEKPKHIKNTVDDYQLQSCYHCLTRFSIVIVIVVVVFAVVVFVALVIAVVQHHLLFFVAVKLVAVSFVVTVLAVLVVGFRFIVYLVSTFGCLLNLTSNVHKTKYNQTYHTYAQHKQF